MPKFSKLKISFNPSENNYGDLTTELTAVLADADLNTNFIGTQARSFAESIEIIDQAKLRDDPHITKENANKLDKYKEKQNEYLRAGRSGLETATKVSQSIENIYGKAVCYGEGKADDVAKEYMRKSNRDAPGFGSLIIIKDGRKTKIDDLSAEVAKHYNKEAINITMDDIIAHLKEQYDVVITDKQANLLRSSWNQASLLGLTESMVIPSVKYNKDQELLRSDNNSREQYFVFSGSLLEKIGMKQNIILSDMDTLEQIKSAELKVDVDISNLREEERRKGSDASTVDMTDRGSDASSGDTVVDYFGSREDHDRKGSNASTVDMNAVEPEAGDKETVDKMNFLPSIDAQARRVTVEFSSSDGLACSIVPEVLDPLVKHADFEGQKTSKSELKKLVYSVPYFASVKSDKKNKVSGHVANPSPIKPKKPITR